MIVTIFQLVSAFLALTVQLKFLFLCLLVFKKFFKLVIQLSRVYIFTQTHPYTSLFASCKCIVLYMDWNHIVYLCAEQQTDSGYLTCSSSILSMCFSICIYRPYLLDSIQILLVDRSLIFSRAFQSGSQYSRIWMLSKP